MAYRDHLITTMEQLQSLYGEKMGASVVKEIDHINDAYRKLIEAAPFVAVATSGPEGLDCSPKGDSAGFVRILDNKTLAIPDRPGNNRWLPEYCARFAHRSSVSYPRGRGDLAHQWPRVDLD
jgi:predicted pyridoxine 5'-phosphate oxidase superfamily flavin-nucleotide-binding protein